MYMTLGKLRFIVSEIVRSDSLISDKLNYDEFVDWARSKADAAPTQEREQYGGFEFQWSHDPEAGTKVLAYDGGSPVGYVGLEQFNDGYKISTLGVKPRARGKGLATTMYDFIITKTKLYSDYMQTPEARRLWMTLARKHVVKGYDASTGRTFDVKPGDHELVSTGDEELYSDKKDDYYLVVLK